MVFINRKATFSELHPCSQHLSLALHNLIVDFTENKGGMVKINF